MERLTKRINGVVVYVGAKNPYSTGQIPCEVEPAGVREMMDRLAAHEDTGLTPELVRETAELAIWVHDNGEAINKANEIEKLKADAEDCLMQLKNANETLDAVSMDLQRVSSEKDDLRTKLDYTKAALGRANAEVSRVTVGCRQVEEERDYMHQQWSNAEQRANYAEAHPWRNLWAWVKKKLG